jgi:endogenous inhibitor of DNA gyrase (YacG/DUF329 family)
LSAASKRLQPKPNRNNPQARCPTCKKSGDWFAGEYGPFCSKRCKLVDLGKWFNAEHAISEPLRPEHFEKYADLPPGKQLDNPETEF